MRVISNGRTVVKNVEVAAVRHLGRCLVREYNICVELICLQVRADGTAYCIRGNRDRKGCAEGRPNCGMRCDV